ncbi:AAA family ATPase [Sporosarcina aquimarina]|uniref:AAA family ATPase n=1 Tax=Sporosarcina aquimarina TaxID=114975 RepID=UPI00203BCAB0|nr:AAA family ATPase [Sporosarcina aquimarina]MCM3757353.1 AAA family ATPase [Sporosarcina aquimarina]
MIKEVLLKDVGSYDEEGASLTDLAKINYLYGSNGSGKTTISEVIRNTTAYPNCQVISKEIEQKTFVYNRNFVEENFGLSSKIKGIFTLGKDQVETIEAIDTTKENIEKHVEKIEKLSEELERVKKVRITISNDFKEECWEIKKRNSVFFGKAIQGFGNSKEKLMRKFIDESQNKRELYSYEDLMKRHNTLYEGSQTEISSFQLIEFNNVIKNQEILSKKVIGSDDVDIADLINKLNISDWVFEGRNYMEHTEGVCPFCQTELPEDLSLKLNRYFDQTYSDQLEILRLFNEDYQLKLQQTMKELMTLVDNSSDYLGVEKIQSAITLITSKNKANLKLIEDKLNEPSTVIVLQDITNDIDGINSEISSANESIKKHNDIVSNSREKKIELLYDIWRFLAEENQDNLNRYKKSADRLDKQITGRDYGIQTKVTNKTELEKELLQLQEDVTSIEHSVTEINNRLSSFGFTNFKLDTAEEEGHYKIVRGNGDDVGDSLSEGEKTFITFLYFYNLIKGSTERDDVSTNKVVVMDDPISSLDSNVLFIVSNLIKEIIVDVKKGHSEIKQIIILTHNIYFHKEISFTNNNQASNEEKFWIVRKSDNKSSIQQYDENPIKSSYELMWNELNLVKDQSLITMQNIMRRILENYFTFFGGITLSDIVEKFEGEEKSTCRSLLSWLHDGSHHINEDLFVERSIDLVENYLKVFKEIFYRMGHGPHYEMMMKEPNIETAVKDEVEQLAQKEIMEAVEQAAASTNE